MTSELYKIGAVAKLTGVSVERLRAWERRYNFTPEARDGQTRFYGEGQLRQIEKISNLADQGHGLAQLMQMDLTELDRRLGHAPVLSKESDTTGFSALFIGNKLAKFASGASITEEFTNIECVSNFSEIFEDASYFSRFDTIVLYQASLDCEEIASLNKLKGSGVVVVYRFWTDIEIESAAEFDNPIIEAQSLDEKSLANTMLQTAFRSMAQEFRFSDRELAHFQDVAVHDGCISAADIVDSLNTVSELETHILRNANTKTHQRIGRSLHQARVQIEDALEFAVVKDELLMKSAYSVKTMQN